MEASAMSRRKSASTEFHAHGCELRDIDNDGFLDIYLGTGNPSHASLVPNVLLRNKRGKSFVDITASSGTGELHKGHGVAFADLDNDGDEEIVAEIGGATPGDSHPLRLFENPGHGNDWISLRLVGVTTNRAAIGVQVKLTVENEGQQNRTIYRTVGSGGSFGASPLEQHIGLGTSARIVARDLVACQQDAPALSASRRIKRWRSPSWREATPGSNGIGSPWGKRGRFNE